MENRRRAWRGRGPGRGHLHRRGRLRRGDRDGDAASARRARTDPGAHRGGCAFEEIAEIEGRSARRRKLEGLRELFDADDRTGRKVRGQGADWRDAPWDERGLMLEAMAKMAGRPVDGGAPRRICWRATSGAWCATCATIRARTSDHLDAPKPAIERARAMKPLKPMLAQPANEIADAFFDPRE